jgi:RNA polymerase sigma factor (sigma-70 family)
MTASRLAFLSRSLSRLQGSPTDDLSDVELLDRYRRGGEEAAFTLLVQRHGPAVLGVCRRVLGNAADADDAFQATFLVLLRKATSIRRGNSLGCWLHGVACRVAVKARTRRVPAAPAGEVFARSDRDPVGEASYRELVSLLDEEIRGLPEKYRAALVLCGPAGRTCEQAARELGWPKSTLALRLGRARELLRHRLLRRGVAVPAAALAAVLAGEAGAGAVPASLTLATVRLARQTAAGGAPAPVAALAEQAVPRTAVARWLVALGLTTALGLAAVAAGSLAGGKREQPDSASSPAEAPEAAVPAPRVDREGFPLPAEALARVGSARLRHGQQLHDLEYAPDGTLLATCGGGPFGAASLRLWDARTGKLLWQTPGSFHDYYSNCPFSADGKRVAAVDGATCRWFDARTGRRLPERDFKLPEGSYYSYLGPHGAVLATIAGNQTGDLVVHDLPSGNERFRKAADGFHWFGTPAFSADGKTLAVMEAPEDSDRYRARLFDLTTGRQTGCFRIGDHFTGLALSSDGKKLAAHSESWKNVRVWSAPDGKLLRQFEPDVNSVAAVAFTPDGKSVIVGSQDLHALQVDLATGKELSRYPTPRTSHRLALTPDGRRLAVGVLEGRVFQFDLATGKHLDASAELSDYRSLHFDSAGKVLQFWDDAVVTVDWRTGREVRRVRVAREDSWDSALVSWDSACLSPDLSRVSVGHDIWDAASGEPTCMVNVRMGNWFVKCFSSDGKTLYVGEGDRPLFGWDVERGKYLLDFDKKPRRPAGLAVSADGRRLALVESPEDYKANPRQEVITVWDMTARRELRRLLPAPGVSVKATALRPDGTYLVVVGVPSNNPNDPGTGLMEIWDTRTGKEWLIRTDSVDPLAALAFSRDGRMLATGSEAGVLTLWEVATRLERHRFAGHENPVEEVTFSRDDKFLASTGCDAPVFVWDVEGRDGRPPSAVPFTSAEATGLWQALDDPKATAAFAAMRRLLVRPGPAVALLREWLKPARTIDEKVLRQLLRDLDADGFAVRDRASAELELVADRAAPALRKALEAKPSGEVKRRIGQLLESTNPGGPGRRRELRAVEVAERIGTAEARHLLETWRGGDKSALLTQEARAAVERLKGR